MGLRRDKNAPKAVSKEEMRAIGPSSAIRQLEPKAENLRTELCKKYGRPSLAPDKEKADYTGVLSQLRTARQKHRRKVLHMLHKDHFNKANESELQKQLQGIHEPIAEKDIIHTLQERKRLVDILGDMDDNLSEEDIVRRKIEAINTMVAYSRICEPLQREQPELKTKKAPVPSQSPFPMIEPGIRSDTDPIQGKPRPSEQRILPAFPGPPCRTLGILTPDIASVPPPPYSEIDPGVRHHAPVPISITAPTPPPPPPSPSIPEEAGSLYLLQEGIYPDRCVMGSSGSPFKTRKHAHYISSYRV